MVDSPDPIQYWGYLFQKNKCATPKLDRLLRGISHCISTTIQRHDSNDLTPNQIATFYRSVGGDYDSLFLKMPAQSIGFIYKSLGCLHSIQPNPLDDGYTAPSIPALKPAGFVTWQTIQLLLGPDEHVPFMQRALLEYDVRDPVDGKPFPKELPKEAFPSCPDAHMVKWHEGVSERLRLEAQEAEQERISTEDRGHSRTSSTDYSADSSTDERADAAHYFSNPFNKDHDGRPAIVRRITKAAPKSLVNGGILVANTVRNIASPFLWTRRSSLPDRSDSSEERHQRSSRHRGSANDDNDSTPTEGRHARHHHHHSRSRRNGSSDRSSASPVQRHNVRRHRSFEPPPSPREYFGAYNGYHGPQPSSSAPTNDAKFQHPSQQQQRQSHHVPSRHDSPAAAPTRTSPPPPTTNTKPAFAPSESPPFAAKVAHMQQQQTTSGAQDPRRARFAPGTAPAQHREQAGGQRRQQQQQQQKPQSRAQWQQQSAQQPGLWSQGLWTPLGGRNVRSGGSGRAVPTVANNSGGDAGYADRPASSGGIKNGHGDGSRDSGRSAGGGGGGGSQRTSRAPTTTTTPAPQLQLQQGQGRAQTQPQSQSQSQSQNQRDQQQHHRHRSSSAARQYQTSQPATLSGVNGRAYPASGEGAWR